MSGPWGRKKDPLTGSLHTAGRCWNPALSGEVHWLPALWSVEQLVGVLLLVLLVVPVVNGLGEEAFASGRGSGFQCFQCISF